MRTGMRPNPIATCAAPLLLAATASAQGGAPLLTDDPGTPGAGRIEINFASRLLSRAGQDALLLPILDFAYGLGERAEVKCEIPWVHLDGAPAPREGLGPSLVGFKWRFADGHEREPALSIYPQLGFETPGSSFAESWEPGSVLVLPVQAAWKLPEFDLNAEFGRHFHEFGSDGWVAGLAIGRSLSLDCELLAEVRGEASPHFDSSAGVLNIGSRVELGGGCRLLASVGCGLWTAESERTDLLAYLGLQVRL